MSGEESQQECIQILTVDEPPTAKQMYLLTQILNLHDISFTCGVLSRTTEVRYSCLPCSLHAVAKGYDHIIFKVQKMVLPSDLFHGQTADLMGTQWVLQRWSKGGKKAPTEYGSNVIGSNSFTMAFIKQKHFCFFCCCAFFFNLKFFLHPFMENTTTAVKNELYWLHLLTLSNCKCICQL